MVLVIAHRGARFEAPENTLTGFRWANRTRAGAVEFDVRLTYDDQLVVIHDATVDRTTNGTGAVGDLTLAELRALDARSRFADWPEPATIPTLAEVLDTVDPRILLMIEIQQDTPEREERIATGIRDELARRDRSRMATISSFDPVAVGIVARVAPGLRRSLIGTWDEPTFMQTAMRHGCIQADMRLDAATIEAVRAAQAAGMVTTAWPCNDEDALDRALELGFDQICTDRPTWLIDCLDRRGVTQAERTTA